MPCVSRPPLHAAGAVLCAALAAAVGGCKSWIDDLPVITPYRIVIQQGNFITQDMVAKLKRGMSREQVRFVLGTPLIADMFHANRWDYVFYREYPNKTREERRVSVFFENDRLARVEGDVVPEGAATKPSAAPAAESKPPAASTAENEPSVAPTAEQEAQAVPTAEQER